MRYNCVTTDYRPSPDYAAGHNHNVRSKPSPLSNLNGLVIVTLVPNGKTRICSAVHACLQIDEPRNETPSANMNRGTAIKYRIKPDAGSGTYSY